MGSFVFLRGHWSLFCFYYEARSCCVKRTLWANVSSQRAALTFTVSSDHWADVACQWETLAQQIYKKNGNPARKKLIFFYLVWLGSLARLQPLTGVQHALWFWRYIKMLKKRGKISTNYGMRFL